MKPLTMNQGREQRRVVITGSGLISPLADDADGLHRALCDGRSGLGPVTFEQEPEQDSGRTPHLAGQIDFDARHYLPDGKLRPLDRTGRLVTAAARLAMADAGLDEAVCEEHEVGLVLGTLYCSLHTIAAFDQRALEAGPQYVRPFDFANSVINAASGQTAIWHRLRGVNATLTGTTAGLEAIAYGADLIATGRSEIVLAGGADELCFESHLAFERSGLLCDSDDPRPVPFDAGRNGLALSENAVLLVLESEASAERRGAKILAEVHGHASFFDPSRGEDVGKASAAIRRSLLTALERSDLSVDDVHGLGASANGSAALDRNEAAGLAAAFDQRRSPLPVTAIKSMAGEGLGASGALQALSLLQSLRHGELPGIHGLDRAESAGEGLSLSAQTRALESDGDRRHGLISSVGLDGQVCSLVLSAPSNGLEAEIPS